MLGFDAFAQFTISGTVRDSKTNEALVGSTIQIEERSRGVITDDQGRFELRNVKSRKTNSNSSFSWICRREKSEIEVSSDLQLDFALSESSQLTDEVTVLATRATENSPTAFSNISRTVIQKNKILGKDMATYFKLDTLRSYHIGCWCRDWLYGNSNSAEVMPPEST